MLEAVREQAASYVMSEFAITHSQAFFFLMIILTHIPKNCTSFHFPALQAPLQASLTH